MSTDLYELDFYAWANEQAALLRARKLSEADLDNIAEEIATLARGEKRELVNGLTALLQQLLKWRHQPGLRSDSGRLQIKLRRIDTARHMKESPSLTAVLAEVIRDAYESAVLQTVAETGFCETLFPAECRWTYEQMMDAEFWLE
jgi:hypothetical protein